MKGISRRLGLAWLQGTVKYTSQGAFSSKELGVGCRPWLVVWGKGYRFGYGEV